MRLLYVSWLAAWAEALVSLPKPTRRLLPLRRAEEEQVDPNVREIVSAAMYGTPAEVAAKAIALSERVAASEAAAAAAAEGVEAAAEKAVALVGRALRRAQDARRRRVREGEPVAAVARALLPRQLGQPGRGGCRGDGGR